MFQVDFVPPQVEQAGAKRNKISVTLRKSPALRVTFQSLSLSSVPWKSDQGLVVSGQLWKKERRAGRGVRVDHSLKIVSTVPTIVALRPEAAFLESACRSRRGRGRCGRASRQTPCRPAAWGRPARRVAHASRRGSLFGASA